MIQKKRRNFLKSGIKYSLILITSLSFLNNNFVIKKIKSTKTRIYKRKYSKVWVLEINDS